MKPNPKPKTDPADAPEKHLSSPHLRPITVSLAVCADSVRRYDEPTRRAALWLCNLAANSRRIQTAWQARSLPDPLGTVGRIAEADLAERLGLEPRAIYRALTGDPEADLPAFRRAVEQFRAAFERAIPPLIRTGDSARIAGAVRLAAEDRGMIEVRGKWRHGKTVEAERHWLQNLHNTIWLHCPGGNDLRSFLAALAGCLGIGGTGILKPGQIEPKIRRALGVGLIERIVVDEAANLWPANLRDARPERLEVLRALNDTLCVGVVLITTEQFGLSMELNLQHNTRWAAGQAMGRIAHVTLRDAHTHAEIREIARLHAGAIDDDALEGLVLFALAEEGYLGSMVKTIRMARADAGAGARLTAAHLSDATRRQQRDDNLRTLAAASVPRRTQRGSQGFKLVTGRAA